MNAFVTHLSDRHEQALEAAGEARSRLITILDEDGPALASAMADVALFDAYARWWTTVANDITDAGTDPITALSRARTTARRILLERTTPRGECPFGLGMAQAVIEAARHFYHDTATLDLDAITPAEIAPPTAIRTRRR
jgi:hypothetical protein